MDGLGHWRFTLGSIRSDFRAGSFAKAGQLVASIAEAAERADHHPDIELRYPDLVRVSLFTHATGSLTSSDVDLARQISSLARSIGADSETKDIQMVEIAIDTTDAERIRPFWAAILRYDQRGSALVDPLRIGPSIWFQQMDVERPQRDRFHVDISVPHDQADSRIAEALAAGGVMVEDRYARSWWVLADADGNEACICTWQDRAGQS